MHEKIIKNKWVYDEKRPRNGGDVPGFQEKENKRL